MIFRNASRVVGALATILLLQGAASAASMVGAGQFNLAGTVYITDTSFLFGYSTAPTAASADQMASVVLPTSGAFSDLAAGELVTMHNLLTPGNGAPYGPGPVVPGSSFTLSPFLALPDGIDVDLSGANPLPVSVSPACGSGAAFDSPGSVCQAVPGSPVTLEQGFNGVTAILSLSGRAYYAGSSTYTPLIGKLSASFANPPDTTISGLLADFNSNGFITTGFQANFSTAPVPEPASMALLGASLFGLGLLGKKKFVK